MLLHFFLVALCDHTKGQHLKGIDTCNIADNYHEVKHWDQLYKVLHQKHDV